MKKKHSDDSLLYENIGDYTIVRRRDSSVHAIEDARDYAPFLMTCIDRVLEQFDEEEFPYITIETLKSDVKSILKADKRYVKSLRRRYRVKNVDEIFEKIYLKMGFLKDEDKFKEFLFMCRKEHNEILQHNRDVSHFVSARNLHF